MSTNRRIAFAVFAAAVGKLVGVLSSLILLPVLFRVMDREELGLWMVLGNSQAFLGLLGFGIMPTLTRHIALARGRAGTDLATAMPEATHQEIADLVASGRFLLRRLALLTFPLALGFGAFFLRAVELNTISHQTVLLAWGMIAAGYAIGVWISYLDCWLAGLGHVGLSGLISAVMGLVTVCGYLAVAMAGWGLVGLAAVLVVSGLLQRTVFLTLIRRKTAAHR